jgi:hypothetical protein
MCTYLDLFVPYLTWLPVAQIVDSRMVGWLMNNKMWKEALVDQFNIYPHLRSSSKEDLDKSQSG